MMGTSQEVDEVIHWVWQQGNMFVLFPTWKCCTSLSHQGHSLFDQLLLSFVIDLFISTFYTIVWAGVYLCHMMKIG